MNKIETKKIVNQELEKAILMETMNKHYVNSVGRCDCNDCIWKPSEKIKYPENQQKHQIIKTYKKENQQTFTCTICHKRLNLTQVILGKCKG